MDSRWYFRRQMLASYHNHTALCNHAEGTEEEYVLHAIKHGYSIFGFSDHAPHNFDEALSSSRMKPDELSQYVERISELKHKYRDYIEIFMGLELEYYPYYHKDDMEFYKKHGIEYLILGQHLIGYRTPGIYKNSFSQTPHEDDYVSYVNQCIEGLQTGNFCYFAHPDVFHYNGDADFYREESDRLILEAKRLGIPLEVNMFGLVDNRYYPNGLFWERVSKLGAKVILGRDAHKVHRVHNDSEFPAAYRFIEKYKLDLIESITIPKQL